MDPPVFIPPTHEINTTQKLNDLCETIKNEYQVLFLQISKKEGKPVSEKDKANEKLPVRRGRKPQPFIDTFFTRCTDSQFINLSSIENKSQFDYQMYCFHQDLYKEKVLKTLNFHDTPEGKFKILISDKILSL